MLCRVVSDGERVRFGHFGGGVPYLRGRKRPLR